MPWVTSTGGPVVTQPSSMTFKDEPSSNHQDDENDKEKCYFSICQMHCLIIFIWYIQMIWYILKVIVRWQNTTCFHGNSIPKLVEAARSPNPIAATSHVTYSVQHPIRKETREQDPRFRPKPANHYDS